MASTLRYTLLVVLMLGLVAGLTWVTQFLPNWRAESRTAPPSVGTAKEVLQFTWPPKLTADALQAVWDDDTGYALEEERNKEGACYFPFRNVLGAPAEFEMEDRTCDCTQAEICLLPADVWTKINEAWLQKPWNPPTLPQDVNWIKITKNPHNGVKIPADGRGLLRIGWHGRKNYGELLNLSLRFWSQPEGDMSGRQITPIRVPVRMVPPVMYDLVQLLVGAIGPGQAAATEFHLWSATRDQLDLEFHPEGTADPLFAVQAEKLNAAECAALQKEIATRKKMLTRVRCGYRVKVVVSEEKEGKRMDLGPFSMIVPLYLDHALLDINGPQVIGSIRGPVTVGGDVDNGKVQFNTFSAGSTKSVVVPVYADPAIKLEVAEYYPPLIQVEFARNAKSSTAQRTQWDLKVTAAPNTITGPFPADSRVVLRIAGDMPRLVRIPILGNSTR